MKDHQHALDKAKIQLMTRKDTVFFTTVLFSLEHKWDENISTAATNGKYIKYNPEFFLSLDKEEQLFLLLHETMHVVFMHMDRAKSYDRRRWNVAGDYVINNFLVERGFKMPQIGLYDPQYKDMSTLEVYNLLANKPPMDLPMEDIELSDEEIKEHVTDILVRAAIQSKMQGDAIGTIPGEVQIYLDSLLEPKLPWHRILYKYLKAIAKFDYSFRKPNKRFFPKHILPGMKSEALIDITIAVDTSGSVSNADFTVFISEIANIFKMMHPEKITLIQFDTEIKEVTVVKGIQELKKVSFTGRGGTSIHPLIDWVEENKPQLLLVFTDGHFHRSHKKPKTPIIWLIHDNLNFYSPFGKTIHYTLGA